MRVHRNIPGLLGIADPAPSRQLRPAPEPPLTPPPFRLTPIAAGVAGALAKARASDLGAKAALIGNGQVLRVRAGDTIERYFSRLGGFDDELYRKLFGIANAPKEGDGAIGALAKDSASREAARALILGTPIDYLTKHPLLADELGGALAVPRDPVAFERVKRWTVGELKSFLLGGTEAQIKAVRGGLNSDVIAALTKTMTDEELVTLSAKIHDALPGSTVGAKGMLAARIQPNSPTDDPEDIQWQVLNGLSFGLHLLLLGTNPVDSTVASVTRVEEALRDMVETFGLQDLMPWCVLAHADVQAEIRKKDPSLVPLMFQSLAGTDATNKTFAITLDKMLDYARSGQPGFYYETGQGSEFTNKGEGGVDMLSLESRKYGFVRLLRDAMAELHPDRPWVHVNDVSGFIGPEVFKTKDQLVRVCLEDLVMAKLHGVTIGLDICATLHMGISLDDLDECQRRIMPAEPAYLMALPTKNDPMLSYLTTSFQDHVRLREEFDLQMDPAWLKFYQSIGVMDAEGKLTEHAGDPLWVYYQYRLRKGDKRSQAEIYADGRAAMGRVAQHGVDLAIGHGEKISDLEPKLDERVRSLYEDAKQCLWAELSPDFVASLGDVVELRTTAKSREEYVSSPPTGEKLSPAGLEAVRKLRASYKEDLPDVQIVIADGLNAKAIMDDGHLAPFLEELRSKLEAQGLTVGKRPIVVHGGRVRAGYAVGEELFASAPAKKRCAIVTLIGERPGTEHRNYSAYLAYPEAEQWRQRKVDHDIVKVVSGISDTALNPVAAAGEAIELLLELKAGG